MAVRRDGEALFAPLLLVAGVLEAGLLEPGHDRWWRVAVVAVAWSGLLVRRRSPAVAAAAAGVGWVVVASGPKADSLALFVLSLLAVGWCGYRGRSSLGSVATPLLVVVPAVAAVVRSSNTGEGATNTAWTVVFYAIAWRIGVGLERIRHRATRAEQSAADAAEATRREVAAALAEERHRIAQDLHDVISHSVTIMSVQAGGAARVIDSDPAAARQSLESIHRVGAQAVEELRRLLAVLRDEGDVSPRAPSPDLTAAESLCASARTTGLDVRIKAIGELSDIAPGPSVAAYRVLQEALTNSRRHGGRCRVDVRVERDTSGLIIEVVNTAGTGAIGERVSTGHGVMGMRERISLYGGTLDAGPIDDGGWAIRAHIPLPALGAGVR